MAPKLITAIDLGSDSVKVVSLRRRKGELQVVGAGMAQLSEAERADGNSLKAAGQAASRIIRKHGIPVGYTVIGLSGRGTMIRYLTVPIVPPWKLSLLMGFEVEEQVASGGGGSEVTHDYRILSLPDIEDGLFAILLSLAQINAVNERLEAGRQAVKHIDNVDLQGLGAFNLFRRCPQCQDEELSLLLDVGAEETHLTMQLGSTLYFARTISFGGRQFTQRVQQTMGMLGPESETYKRERAAILSPAEEEISDGDTVKLSRALKGEVRSLVGGIQGSLRYFTGQFKLGAIQPQKIYLSGGGSRLQGFAEAIGESFKTEVEYIDLINAVTAKGNDAEAMLSGEGATQFVGAIGLAAGTFPGGFNLSLLPPKEVTRREFWRSKIYTYYSAALALTLLILLGVGGCPLYGGGWREAAYSTERLKAWEEHVKNSTKSINDLQKTNDDNTRLMKQHEALEIRRTSGPDLYYGLEHIRRQTPDYVFYTEMRTGEIPRQLPVAGDEKKKETDNNPRTSKTTSFQTNRFLELGGLLVGASKEQVAVDLLTKLKESLRDDRIFPEVEIQFMRELEPDSPEIAKAYTLKLFPDESEKIFKARKGIALMFVIRCKFR